MHATRVFVLALAVLASACGRDGPKAAAAEADLVLRNGFIYTVDAAKPKAISIAIRSGRIAALGGDEDVASLIGATTRVVDLKGKLVLPGFHDAHAHPVWGGLSYSRCPLYDGNSPQDYQKLIAHCAAETPEKDWLYGSGWKDGLFEPEGVPDRKLLDAVVPDRPAAFLSVGGHSIWVNSKGLEVAGVTRATPDPPNGRIDRDAKGDAVGALQESAIEMITKLLPPPTAKEREDALRYALRYFNGIGIVGWQDASVPLSSADPAEAGVLETYEALQRKGELKAHVVLALKWDNTRGLEQIPELVAASQRASKLGLRAKTVKFFVDGVLAQRTAALLEPYADQPSFRGELQIQPEMLDSAVTQLDGAGFQVHVHAIGDAAVRAALDAFEKAQAHNGKKGNRHLVSHTNLVATEDLKRFADLGVTAVFQPLWAQFDPYMVMTGVRVGKARLEHMYPAASLLRARARIAYGSDWSVASANPFEGIEVALTRLPPGAEGAEPLAPDERVTLAQAIEAYTLGAARADHKDDVSGSLTVGKSADLVVLDRNVFEVTPNQIGITHVLLTLYGGEAVHGGLDRL